MMLNIFSRVYRLFVFFFSEGEYLVKSLAYFKIGLCIFLLLHCETSLYILDRTFSNQLYDLHSLF